VDRSRDAEDERRVRVSLTPAGRKLRAQARKVPAQVLHATGCGLDEVASLTRRLSSLRESLVEATPAH